MSLSLSPLSLFFSLCMSLFFSWKLFTSKTNFSFFFFHQCLCERDLCCCHCHGSSSLEGSKARTHTHNLFHPIVSALLFHSVLRARYSQGKDLMLECVCVCNSPSSRCPSFFRLYLLSLLLLHLLLLFFFYSNAQMNV